MSGRRRRGIDGGAWLPPACMSRYVAGRQVRHGAQQHGVASHADVLPIECRATACPATMCRCWWKGRKQRAAAAWRCRPRASRSICAAPPGAHYPRNDDIDEAQRHECPQHSPPSKLGDRAYFLVSCANRTGRVVPCVLWLSECLQSLDHHSHTCRLRLRRWPRSIVARIWESHRGTLGLWDRLIGEVGL